MHAFAEEGRGSVCRQDELDDRWLIIAIIEKGFVFVISCDDIRDFGNGNRA